MDRLQDKVALITGGASGIGLATARRFASEGAAVCVADRAADGVRAAVESLRADGARAHGVELDVSDAIAVQALVVETVRALGGLHILVCSAGIGGGGPLQDLPLEQWERILRVNLTGTFLCTQAAARHMIAQRYGRIIHLASAWGQRGVTWATAYSASKGGVIAFMKGAAVELGRHGITVNAICPGPIETPLVQKHHNDEVRNRVADVTPIARYGEAEEVAAAAAFLASDEAAYVSGHQLNVDGGYGGAGILFHHRERDA